MAIQNEILVGRFNKALSAIFGMKGAAPVPQLGAEIMPVYPIDTSQDARFEEGWNRWGIALDQGGAVGLQSFLQLFNPPSSGVITVIEKIRFETPAAPAPTSVFVGAFAANTGNGTVAIAAPLDSRQGLSLTVSSATQPRAGNGGGSGVRQNIENFSFPGGGLFFFDTILTVHQEIVLLPGSGIEVVTGSLNVELIATFHWRERVLEDSERR